MSPSCSLRELLETTCRLANTLKTHGISRGDRVAIYMPVSPLAVAAMLACARIGAVHTVVFAGFSSEALAGRIQDGESSWFSAQSHSVSRFLSVGVCSVELAGFLSTFMLSLRLRTQTQDTQTKRRRQG